MKNKRIKKVFKMLGACFLIGAVSLSSIGCNVTTQGEVPDIVTSHAESSSSLGFDVIASNTAELKLFSSEPTVVNNQNSVYIERKITATVYPLDTKLTDVYWELAWNDETDEDVSNYVLIEPSESDSRILTLKCIAPFFNKEMTLTCMTMTGQKATAKVSYYGTPTNFAISPRPALINEGELSYYPLHVGESYNPTIYFNNVFGINGVNPEFKPEISLHVQAFGSVKLSNGEILDLTAKRVDGPNFEIYLTTHGNPNDIQSESLLSLNLYDEVNLLFTINQAVESFEKDGVVYESTIEECFFTMVVMENVTGRNKGYNFKIEV